VRIHETRLVIFQGLEVVKGQVVAHVGWGDSIFNRIYKVMRDFIMAHEAAATLLGDFSQAIYKIKGLAELIARNQDEAVVARARLVDMMRSTIRAILIDSEEDFERKSTDVSGLPDVLDRLALLVAAACDMPVTVLMGQQPAGLNATGESDIRNWYDHLAGEQEDKIRDGLEKITRCIFKAGDGPTGGEEPESWSVKFLPLWTMTDAEQADLRSKVATADAAYVTAGVLLPEEVAESRFGGDEWSMETQLDDTARKEFEAQQQAQQEQEAAAAQAALEAARAGVPRRAPLSKDRKDYDPDQPRDENGRFGENGGGAGSATPKGRGTTPADIRQRLTPNKATGEIFYEDHASGNQRPGRISGSLEEDGERLRGRREQTGGDHLSSSRSRSNVRRRSRAPRAASIARTGFDCCGATGASWAARLHRAVGDRWSPRTGRGDVQSERGSRRHVQGDGSDISSDARRRAPPFSEASTGSKPKQSKPPSREARIRPLPLML
jgi:hypothetical protein